MSLNNYTVKNPNSLIGVVAGCDPDTYVVNKFGYNPDIDNSSEPESVWSAGGLYPWDAFTTAITLSSTANDTGEVIVYGLDQDYNEQQETITLTGTTAVTLVNQFKRIYRMQYENGNTGTIKAFADGSVVAQIDAGDSQTLMSLYTVPSGCTGFLLNLNASINKAKDAQVRMYVREFGGEFRIKHVFELYENSYVYDLKVPMKIKEKSDIEFRVHDVENSNTRVTLSFDMLIDKCLNY